MIVTTSCRHCTSVITVPLDLFETRTYATCCDANRADCTEEVRCAD